MTRSDETLHTRSDVLVTSIAHFATDLPNGCRGRTEDRDVEVVRRRPARQHKSCIKSRT